MTTIAHDTHNYAEGTRARKILRFLFAPVLRKIVRALLWLCPDEVIVANAKLGMNGHAITIGNGQSALITRVHIHNASTALFALSDPFGERT